MLARPLVIRSSPQAIPDQGISPPPIAITANGISRRFQPGLTSGRRMAATITASVTKPEAERMSTRAVGLMSLTATLMNRNDAPQMRASTARARYGSSGFLGSDTRRPVIRREHERDRAVVLDADPHDSPKASRAGLYSALAQPVHEGQVEILGTLGVAGTEQARPPASAHVGEESELRHDQSRATHVDEAEIHPPRLVGEHAEVDHLVRQSPHRRLIVIRAC